MMPLVPAPLFRAARTIFSPYTLLGPRQNRRVRAAFRAAPLGDLGPGYVRRMTMIRGVDLLDELPRIQAPTHVFAADSDRVVDSIPAGEAIVEGLPRARLTVIENAGHIVLPLDEEPWLERLQELDARA